MNPIWLEDILDSLPFLDDKSWITTSPIDSWLMAIWETFNHPKTRYIPSQFIRPVGNGVDNEEVGKFRELYEDLPQMGKPCPLENILYILNSGGSGGNHFCVILVSPGDKKSAVVYRLGLCFQRNSRNTNSADWDSWKGDFITRQIIKLMGWDIVKLELHTVDWKQNGYDCGPIACQVAQHIMQHGLILDSSGNWKRPFLPCCHPLRLKMAETAHKYVIDGCQRFREVRDFLEDHLKETLGSELECMDSSLASMEKIMNQDPVGSPVLKVIRNLDKAMRNCTKCLSSLEVEGRKNPSHRNIAGQSLLSGGVTMLEEKGVSPHLIQAAGCWSSEVFRI